MKFFFSTLAVCLFALGCASDSTAPQDDTTWSRAKLDGKRYTITVPSVGGDQVGLVTGTQLRFKNIGSDSLSMFWLRIPSLWPREIKFRWIHDELAINDEDSIEIQFSAMKRPNLKMWDGFVLFHKDDVSLFVSEAKLVE